MKVNVMKEKLEYFMNNNDLEEDIKGQIVDLLNIIETITEEDANIKYKRLLVDNEVVECEECGDLHFIDDTYETYTNSFICHECYGNYNYFTCDHCGLAVHPDNFNSVDNDEYWCPDCVDNYANWCDGCESYVSGSTYTIYTSADRSTSAEWCESCVGSGDADYCNECGEYFTSDCGSYDEDNDEWYCDECYGEHCPDLIHNYSFKPTPDFRKTSAEQNIQNNKLCFFGTETEVDGQRGVNNKKAVEDLNEILNDFFYYKNDGSLNYGFECVSHPATINYWLENKDTIKRAFESLVNNNLRSHETSTCGYHIHASRDYLGDTIQEQEETINKILLILEGFRTQVERFSRRKEYRWSAFLSDMASNNNYIKDKNDITNVKVINKVKQQATGRYAVLNLNNSNTIELRVLRGTLNIETFMAGLQFFKNIIDIAKTKTEKQINGMKWGRIINYNKDFTELKAYNKRRGIDNDAVLTVNKTPQTLVIGDKVKIVDNGQLEDNTKDLFLCDAVGTVTGFYYRDYIVSFTKTELKRINKWLKDRNEKQIYVPNNTRYCININGNNLKRYIKEEIEKGEQ